MSRRSKKDDSQREAEVESEVWAEIEFVCPVRGLVKQKVKGTRYKSLKYVPAAYTAEGLTEENNVDEEDPSGPAVKA